MYLSNENSPPVNLQSTSLSQIPHTPDATSTQAICESLAEIVYLSSITPDVYTRSHQTMRTILSRFGVNFEGREIPISLRPNVLSTDYVNSLSHDLAHVRRSIVKLVTRLRFDLQSGIRSSLADYFSHYDKWFNIIASERRSLPDVMLMRFDLATCIEGTLRAMESNAACPGGVIHCAHLRNAWLQTTIGKRMLATFDIRERAVDDPFGFVRFLITLAADLGGGHVAICNYNGIYTNELQSLVRASESLHIETNPGARIIVVDVTDVTVSDGTVYAHDIPVRIIYNKIDPLMIDPDNPSLQGWIAASRTGTCDFLNSFGAMYIGEAKSVFAALSQIDFQNYLNLSSEQRAAIERRVCSTARVIDVYASADYPHVATHRHEFVLKEDAATRGRGVIVGSDVTMTEWTSKMADYCDTNGVSQSALQIPTRSSLQLDEETGDFNNVREYYGSDAFFFGEEFAGLVSRCHSSSVFNVGNGGTEVPTIVVSPRTTD